MMKEKILKHKNLLLFLILVLGITATYFFEERANILSEAKREKEITILNVEEYGDITQIEGIKLNLEKRGSDYFDRNTNLKLSSDRLDEFFTILAGLKVKSALPEEEVNKVGMDFYIPDPSMKLKFKFQRGELEFTLGKKLDYDQSFYMLVEKKGQKQIVVAYDASPDPGVYENEDDYKKSDAKYKRLEIIFLLTNKYFQDTRLFKTQNFKEDSFSLDSVSIATFRNKKYSVSFKKEETIPPAPKGVRYFSDNWISFYRFLVKLEARSLIFPAEMRDLSEPLSIFELKDINNKTYTLEVYKRYQELNGYFLKTSFDNILYELKPEDAQYFFVNIQDFWQKKINFDKKNYNLKIQFYTGSIEDVAIEDSDLFKVKSPANKFKESDIRPLEFKKLIDFLKSEGNHVSELDMSPSEILKKTIFTLNFENRKLNVILNENEAVIVDLDQKLMIHHYVGAKLPFSIKYEDYFVVKK